MRIKQTRVRTIPRAITSLGVQGPIVLAVEYESRFRPRLQAIGLQLPPVVNDSILPAGIGSVSRFNAEGKYVPDKTQPMETVYRQIEWSWEQWNGPYRETVTDIREVPYKRYPRNFTPPPGVELSVVATLDNTVAIATPPIDLSQVSGADVCHRINLMLEIFGECDVLREDLSGIVRAPVTRLNWRVLPAGQRTWAQLQPLLQTVINAQPQANRSPLIFRLQSINDRGPDFVAIGSGGFRDYVVFGFTARNLFILESPMMDNATYVFGNDWNTLAQLSKTELIAGNLFQQRLIHRNNWINNIAASFP